MTKRSLKAGSAAATAVLALAACADRPAPDTGWIAYGGGPLGDRYSELDQIDRQNVSRLRQVWRFDMEAGGLQTNPLVIGGVLYGYTPTQDVVALDAATGARKWRFDPGEPFTQPARGLTYWTDGQARRLFVSHKTDLIAIDPGTGRTVEAFGVAGRVDLREGLGREPGGLAVYLTSPGVIFRDLIIVGFRTSETKPSAPGAIRAYDVRTGALRWTFNLIPQRGEPGGETWPADAWKTAGGANAWAGLVVDAERGVVFTPTGSAADDFFGGDRHGDNLYANSLVALDAATGRRLWHFQAVRHDIWDMDLPAPPVLLTVRRQGRPIDVVAQTSKHGFVFVFDRATGRPIFPIEERPTPRSTVPGEAAAPTQPFPTRPAPFVRQRLTEDMLTERTPEAAAAVREAFRGYRNEGLFTPLGLYQKTIVFPSFDGGAEWGGPAVDRRRGVLYVNAHEWVSLSNLTRSGEGSGAIVGKAEALYRLQCGACHGADRAGSPPAFPSLRDIASRLSLAGTASVIRNGTGRMPGFPHITGRELDALVAFVRTGVEAKALEKDEVRSVGVAPPSPYAFAGYGKFTDPAGYPAVKPPWGTLSAIDLNTGDYLWRIPLGEHPELTAKGVRPTGTENYGGPIVTAGGLVIIGATVWDRKIRAFHSRTGRTLWQAPLPYSGVATPVTYAVGGRQYVVIATSGARDPNGPKGSAYVAFALPQ